MSEIQNKTIVNLEDRLVFLNEEITKAENKLKDLEVYAEEAEVTANSLISNLNKISVSKGEETNKIDSRIEELKQVKVKLDNEIKDLNIEKTSVSTSIENLKEEVKIQEGLKDKVQDETIKAVREKEVTLEKANQLIKEADIKSKQSQDLFSKNLVEEKRLNDYAVSLQEQKTKSEQKESSIAYQEKTLNEKSNVLLEKELFVSEQQKANDNTASELVSFRKEVDILKLSIQPKLNEITKKEQSLWDKEDILKTRDVELKKREEEYILKFAELNNKERTIKIKAKELGLNNLEGIE